MLELKRRLNLTLVIISHDLSVVRHLCDRVVVMHHGKLVEELDVAQIFDRPQQAYTRMLLYAVPKLA